MIVKAKVKVLLFLGEEEQELSIINREVPLSFFDCFKRFENLVFSCYAARERAVVAMWSLLCLLFKRRTNEAGVRLLI